MSIGIRIDRCTGCKEGMSAKGAYFCPSCGRMYCKACGKKYGGECKKCSLPLERFC